MNDVLCFITTANYTIAVSECNGTCDHIGNKLFFKLVTTENNKSAQKLFFDDLAYINSLKNNSINCNLYNILPCYTYEPGSYSAYTSYYESSFLCHEMNPEEFLISLGTVFRALYECSILSNKLISVFPHSVIIEKNHPEMVHFLFLDCSDNSRNEIAALLEHHLKSYKASYYNVCADVISSMTGILRESNFDSALWKRLTYDCDWLQRVIRGAESYFINSIPDPNVSAKFTNEIQAVLQKHHGILVLYTKDTFRTFQESLSYAHIHRNEYENIAIGNAACGIKAMLKSKSFSTNRNVIKTGIDQEELISMCQKRTLLIIENYDWANEDNSFLMKLHSSDVLLITDNSYFKDEQDLIDYGLTYLLI